MLLRIDFISGFSLVVFLLVMITCMEMGVHDLRNA